MSDSWLEPMRKETERIKGENERLREETQRLREENEVLSKINVKEQFGHLLDGFLPNENEIDDLRKSKRELSQYGKEKFRELNINMKLIDRYNEFYNCTCAGLPHGSPISMEHLQAISIKSAIYAFARKYNLKESIPVEELNNLADLIEKQGDRTVQEVSEVHRQAGLDTL
jgi:curved DNA-binding protein CbpA